MKLSDLRPCDCCGGGLMKNKDGSHYPLFYIVNVDRGLFNPRAMNRVLGMAQFFQGSLTLAEVMGADGDDAVPLASKVAPECKPDKYFVCMRCYNTVPMGVIGEAYDKRQAEAEELAERGSRENGDPING